MPVKNISLTQPTDYGLEGADIERRRAMAALMQKQALDPIQPGRGPWGTPEAYVHPSNYLGKLAQGLAGTYIQSQQDDRAKALAGRMREDTATDLEQFQRLREGTPAVPMPPDDIGGGPGRAAVPGDQRAAYAALLRSQNPMLQQMGMSGLMAKPEGPIKLGKDDRLVDPKTYANLVNPTPAPPRYHNVGGNLVPEPTAPGQQVTPVFTAPEKDEAAKFKSVLKGAGIDPESPQGQEMFRQLALKTATHQKPNVVNVDARERQKTFENENKLRDDYVTASKPFVGIRDAYNTVKAALSGPTTAASTLAGATKFMKMIDPESVVRESELQMALKTSGVLDRFMNIHNTIMQGQVLTPRQKSDMIKITQTLYEAAEKQQKKTDDYYSGLAQQYQLAPERVVRNQGAVAAQPKASDIMSEADRILGGR